MPPAATVTSASYDASTKTRARTVTTPLQPPTAKLRPSRLQATAVGADSIPLHSNTDLPVNASTTHNRPSSFPATTRFPSGEKATHCTHSTGPLKVREGEAADATAGSIAKRRMVLSIKPTA